MVDPKLMDVAMEGIAKLGHGHQVRLLRYCEDMAELHSSLRERIFSNDNRTANFIKQCQDQVKMAQVADNKASAKL